MIAMHSSRVFCKPTVKGLGVIISDVDVVFGSLWGNKTLMAQSPCETMPVSFSSSTTRTARTLLSRINFSASSVEAFDETE